MDKAHRAALEELIAEHRAVRAQLARLEAKIEKLRQHLENPAVAPDEPKEALPPIESIPAFPPPKRPPASIRGRARRGKRS